MSHPQGHRHTSSQSWVFQKGGRLLGRDKSEVATSMRGVPGKSQALAGHPSLQGSHVAGCLPSSPF